jgi:thiamine transporter ThiT
MPEPRQFRSYSTFSLSIVMIVIGVILCIRTVAAGGGPLASGLILGVLFVVAGAGRIYVRRLTR